MHHKRKRPKNQRNGCWCKWWKANGIKGTRAARTRQEQRAILREKDES